MMLLLLLLLMLMVVFLFLLFVVCLVLLRPLVFHLCRFLLLLAHCWRRPTKQKNTDKNIIINSNSVLRTIIVHPCFIPPLLSALARLRRRRRRRLLSSTLLDAPLNPLFFL